MFFIVSATCYFQKKSKIITLNIIRVFNLAYLTVYITGFPIGTFWNDKNKSVIEIHFFGMWQYVD